MQIDLLFHMLTGKIHPPYLWRWTNMQHQIRSSAACERTTSNSMKGSRATCIAGMRRAAVIATVAIAGQVRREGEIYCRRQPAQ
jgi:hypothetical protein